MTLAEFIQENLEAILVEWEAFARTIVPATKGMSAERLRDHAREMLTARDSVYTLRPRWPRRTAENST